MWRDLPEESKLKWQAQRKAEFAMQRAAAEDLGIVYRRPLSDGRAAPSEAALVTAAPATAAPAAVNLEMPPVPPAAGPSHPLPTDLVEIGSTFFGRYSLIAKIGSGTYGTVYEAKDDSIGRSVAIKFMRNNSGFARGDVQEDLKHEATVLHTVCQNAPPELAMLFPKLLGSVASGPLDALIFELVSTTPVHRATCPLPRGECRAVACQLLLAIARLHDVSYCHLDVHPGNCLWRATDQRLWLTDFGCSEALNAHRFVQKQRFTHYGTPPTRAPELRGGATDEKAVAPPVDYWACGCVLYNVATGKQLFPPPRCNVASGRWTENDLFHRGAGHYRKSFFQELGLDVEDDLIRGIIRLCHPMPAERPFLRAGATGPDAKTLLTAIGPPLTGLATLSALNLESTPR